MFNPEDKFFRHSNVEHKQSLERKSFDFKYQKEFRDYFLGILEQANIDISDSLKGHFEVPKDEEDAKEKIASAYISPSSFLSAAITPNSNYPESRLLLDDKLRDEVEAQINQLPLKEQVKLSYEERDKLITEAYAKKVDMDKLTSLLEKETDPAKKNLLLLIIQVINPDAIPKVKGEVKIDKTKSEVKIGRCIMSERHILAYISGRHIKPESGHINLILDDNGEPLMLEKIRLGDSHSCISLKPVRIDGVLIPAGAIFYAEPDIFEPVRTKMKWFNKKEGAINYVTKVNNYKGFKFARMSLLSVPEEIRASACGGYYLIQQDKAKGYINYDWITPKIITEYAQNRLGLNENGPS